mmetsp:Transcript_55344/g.177484  ORF Transcript_55344/g.177484 Transcript_55344/m.177484 type:complete len:215 (+) Transcript_55344:832-1476(+)
MTARHLTAVQTSQWCQQVTAAALELLLKKAALAGAMEAKEVQQFLLPHVARHADVAIKLGQLFAGEEVTGGPQEDPVCKQDLGNVGGTRVVHQRSQREDSVSLMALGVAGLRLGVGCKGVLANGRGAAVGVELHDPAHAGQRDQATLRAERGGRASSLTGPALQGYGLQRWRRRLAVKHEAQAQASRGVQGLLQAHKHFCQPRLRGRGHRLLCQ